MEDVLVVGAGFAGLAAALALSRRGARVRVIERASVPGGLAASAEFRGIPCDLGSHRIHPDALRQPLLRELHEAEPFLRRSRRGVLLLAGQRIPYPPSAADLVAALGVRRAAGLGVSAFERAWRPGSNPNLDADPGFERLLVERVGRGVFEAFYAPYVRKVFGLPPEQLSYLVAKKRLSSRAPWTVLRSIFSRSPAVSGEFYYPRRGFASLVDALLERLRPHGVSVELGRPFSPSDLRGRPVVFTGDLVDLVPTTLAHRGLYLLFLAVARSRRGLAETTYAPEAAHWFGRVSELANYSPELAHPGESVLCVEIPEGAWGAGVDFTEPTRFEVLRGQLARAGIWSRDEPLLEVRQRFLPRVYPLYRRGFIDEWRRTLDRVAALGSVFPVGRQALFLHTNLDHSADIALEVAQHLDRGGDAPAWIAGAARFLDLVVRD